MEKPNDPAPEFVHERFDEADFVGLRSIKVLILNDDGSWFAQGLDVDYAAEGTSLDDVKQRFAEGLIETIDQQLDQCGRIDHLLRLADPEFWQRYYDATKRVRLLYSSESIHLRPIRHDAVSPFEQELNVEYLVTA